MLVKCPKCRYCFDSPFTPGMTVLQCFCPRCGQPFSYDLNLITGLQEGQSLLGMPTMQEGVSPDSSAQDNDDQSTCKRDEEKQQDNSESLKGVDVTADGAGKSYKTTHRSEIYKRGDWMPTDGVVPRGTDKQGCIQQILVVIFCCIAFFFVWSHCSKPQNHYTVQDIGSSKEPLQQGTAQHFSESEEEEDKTDTVFNDINSSNEEAPNWIEGTWHADTEYGGIDVSISGQSISETTDGETSKGTFRYHDDALYCDFGDNTLLEYKLDSDRHLIDAGRGVYMEKVK